MNHLIPFFSKLCLIISLMITATFALYADVPPSWYNLSMRNSYYPKETYFSGFVIGEQQPNENLQQAMDRIKREAQVEAASSIRMRVEKTLTETNRSELIQAAGVFDEKVTEQFVSFTQLRVDMEIPGLKVEVWKDETKKEIAAFAYVKKSELISKLNRRIIAGITKAELALENIERLINDGRKSEARKAAEEGLLLFKDIEEAQTLLLAIDNGSADLQLSETLALKQSMSDRLTELQHGIAICLRITAYCNENPYPYLEKQLQGELNTIGCHFTNDAATADWIVSVDAKTREYQHTTWGNVDMYVSYMDAQISIVKTNTGQRIYEDLLTVKGTHTLNFDEAARDAYKGSAKKIGNVITQTITQ